MTLETRGLGLRRTHSPKDAKRGDFSLPDGWSIINTEKSRLSVLDQAVREFKEKPHTPEVVTSYWQTLWEVWGEKAPGLSIRILPCDRTVEEIKQLEKEGRKLVYVPNEVASEEDLHLLGKIFPKLQCDSVKKNYVTNDSNQGGWFDVEASLDSRNTGFIKKKAMERLFKKQGKAGQRLNTFIVASQEAKLQTGHYFDEDTWSRLFGSRADGHGELAAGYLVDGRLNVHFFERSFPDSSMFWGGRSEGVKKA